MTDSRKLYLSIKFIFKETVEENAKLLYSMQSYTIEININTVCLLHNTTSKLITKEISLISGSRLLTLLRHKVHN